MRTTIRIDDQLLAEAKKVAARTGKTLTSVIEDALREKLARRKALRRAERVSLVTDGEGGLRPGVDLDHTSDLLDLMDRGDAAD